MKKSTKVALSLLVPAMTAYGCSNQPTTVKAPANAAISNQQGSTTIQMNCSCGHIFTVGSDRVGGTVQCPKCNRWLSVSHDDSHNNPHYNSHNNHPYRSGLGFFGWTGGSSRAPSTGTSNPNVLHGGFGTTGAHLPGGS